MSIRSVVFFLLGASAWADDLDILNNTDSLAETISEYSEAYTPRQSFSLQGIVLTSSSWVIWVNNKEINDSSNRYINLGDKIVEIVQVGSHSVTLKCGICTVTVGVGKSYDFKRGEFSDF
jgi:hypothetical protein